MKRATDACIPSLVSACSCSVVHVHNTGRLCSARHLCRLVFCGFAMHLICTPLAWFSSMAFRCNRFIIYQYPYHLLFPVSSPTHRHSGHPSPQTLSFFISITVYGPSSSLLFLAFRPPGLVPGPGHGSRRHARRRTSRPGSRARSARPRAMPLTSPRAKQRRAGCPTIRYLHPLLHVHPTLPILRPHCALSPFTPSSGSSSPLRILAVHFSLPSSPSHLLLCGPRSALHIAFRVYIPLCLSVCLFVGRFLPYPR
ncbi:hypothetical protein BC628DRAFT_1007350 [Trametes gibbosa]|nr:hypothetical protein BC628DRAFT_1007350 [Trametes gibbosa]